MSRVLVITAREGATEQLPIVEDGMRVPAVAGMTYQITDTTNPNGVTQATIRKSNDDLVVDLDSGKTSVVIEDFYFVCQFDFRSCKLDLTTLGGANGESISPNDFGTARQGDGSVLVWQTGVPAVTAQTTTTVAQPAPASDNATVVAAPSDRAQESPAPVGSDTGSFGKWGLIGGGLAGLALVAAAGGGGGGTNPVGSDSDEGDPVGDGDGAGGGNVGGGSGGDNTGGENNGGGGSVAGRTATVTAVISDAPAPAADPAGLNIRPGIVSNGGHTNDASLDLTGALDGALQSGSVIVLRDGVSVGTASVNGQSWSFTDNNVPSGSHTYSAVVQNDDGSIVAAGNSYTVDVDHTAPTVTLGDIAADNIIAGSEGRADVTVAGQTEAGARVQVSVAGNEQTLTADSSGGFTFSFDPAELGPAGTYAVIAQAIDSYGNVGSTSNEFALDSSAISPVTQRVEIDSIEDDRAAIVGEVDAGGVTNDRQPELAGSLTESLQPGQTLNVFVNGQNAGQASVAGTNWSFEMSELTDGAYSVEARVLDASGDSYAASRPVEFSVDATNPDRPVFDVVEGNSVLDLDEVLDGVQMTGRGEAGATITATWLDAEVSGTVAANGRWELEFDELPDSVRYGPNVISVVQTDTAGNESASRDRPVWLEVRNPGEIGADGNIATQASNSVLDDLSAGNLNNTF